VKKEQWKKAGGGRNPKESLTQGFKETLPKKDLKEKKEEIFHISRSEPGSKKRYRGVATGIGLQPRGESLRPKPSARSKGKSARIENSLSIKAEKIQVAVPVLLRINLDGKPIVYASSVGLRAKGA